MTSRSNAGRYRHKATFQTATATRTDEGDLTRTWATMTDGLQWCSLDPLMGREREYAAQIVPTATHKLTCRYVASLTTAERVLVGGTTYNIDRIDNRAHEDVELVCYVSEDV